MAAEPAIELSSDRLHIRDLAPGIAGTARVVGGVGLVAAVALALLTQDAASFFRGYLVNLCYFVSLALGALFFVLIQHVTRAGWSVCVRRVAESCMAFTPLAILSLVLLVPMLVGFPASVHDVYSWTNAELVQGDEILSEKAAYLNVPFLIVRMAINFGIWIGLAAYFYRLSVAQDQSGDDRLTLRMQRLSAPAIILFALTTTIFAFDLLMSLDPYWFSTIFGVYYFSGAVVGFLALLALLLFLLQQAGRLQYVVNDEHYHDVGKLLFAFVVFWAYIGFSQYMLIWYANLPEETTWVVVRQSSQWVAVSLLLLFGHFFVPFLGLIARLPKRRRDWLAVGAIWLLFMHWIDVFWLGMPHRVAEAHAPGGTHELAPVAPISWLELAQSVLCFIAIGGIMVSVVVRRLARASLIPQRDPRLSESLAFENV